MRVPEYQLRYLASDDTVHYSEADARAHEDDLFFSARGRELGLSTPAARAFSSSNYSYNSLAEVAFWKISAAVDPEDMLRPRGTQLKLVHGALRGALNHAATLSGFERRGTTVSYGMIERIDIPEV